MLENAVIITGAAQRVGLALALHLQHNGFQVVATYRSPRKGVEQLQAAGVTCVQADFSSTQGVKTFINWIDDKVKSIRALVHNASDWCAEKGRIDAELLKYMMQIHVEAPYLINLSVEDKLVAASETADIIHITDYTVEKGSDKHIAYCASKAALDNLTLSFAKKFAPKVKVNTIAPSLLMFNQDDDEAYRVKTLKKSVLGIEPGAQEVVEAVAFILKSNYMTGRQLKLDGGRHIAF
ncbi:short chain dehydrogenase [Catenovulum agarivorans DS-2]|uniref:Dihydromonapterin reductase n=1 Tax=Catenovulum agarivorans DS-2 TaxID=1328313 RepID=W7QKA6_9ALTE|nr:dihydromonapterin reductase [Catenovulum agarivorans]EWH08548.1 short chain dehydrogenase [Catenovulum agarivorans DS-2]